MTDINEYARRIHELATSKGWWDRPLEERIGRLLEWLQEELDEAIKEWGLHGGDHYYTIDSDGLAKPEGIGTELVDIGLLTLDMLEGLGFDSDELYQEKLAYNRVRKYKRDTNGEHIA